MKNLACLARRLSLAAGGVVLLGAGAFAEVAPQSVNPAVAVAAQADLAGGATTAKPASAAVAHGTPAAPSGAGLAEPVYAVPSGAGVAEPASAVPLGAGVAEAAPAVMSGAARADAASVSRSSPALPETVVPLGVALPDRAAVVALALRENPQLRAVRWNIERAKGRLDQSGRLENPELGLWGRSDVMFSNEGEYAFGVSLSQAFPLAARLRHERAASRAQLEAAQAEVEQNGLLIAGEAVGLWRDAIEAQARLHLLRKQEALSLSSAEAIAQAVARGERSVLDADQAELETLSLRTRIRQAQLEAAQTQAALRQVLGAPEHIALELPEPQALPQVDPLREWHRVNVDALPAVRSAAALVTAADAELAGARAQSYGDVTVAIDFEQGRGEDVPVGKRTDRYLGLSVSVPLPVWNRYDGNIAEYTAARRAAQATLAAERYRARASLSAVAAEVSSAFESAHLVQQGLLVRARQSAQRVEQGWQQGELGLAELLRARSNLIDIELEALRLGSTFHRALDRHAAASGQLSVEQQ